MSNDPKKATFDATEYEEEYSDDAVVLDDKKELKK